MKASKVAFLINEVRESVNDLGVEAYENIIINIMFKYIEDADKASDVLSLVENNDDKQLVQDMYLLLIDKEHYGEI